MLSFLDIWSMGEGQGAPSFYNTIRAYINDGWDLTLIQPTSTKRPVFKVENCKTIKFNNSILEKLCTIKKVSFFARIISAYYCTIKFYNLAAKLLKRDTTGYVIYAYEVHGVQAGKKLSKKFGLPLISRFQGTVLKNYENTWLNRLKIYPHFNALEQESNLIIMTDDGTEGDKILKKLGNHTKNIYFWKNGQAEYDCNKSNPEIGYIIRDELRIPQMVPILLTVSRLASWKRIDRAINSMPDVIKHYPDCKLVIVGGGDEYENLKGLTEQYGIEESVIFTGPVEQKDVWKYFNCADVFLSLYDLSNLGNPLMEAMRHGKAIITIDVGQTFTVIENEVNGILLPINQSNNIAPAIIRLLSNEELRNSLGHNAKEYAKNNFWSWKDRMEAELSIVNALKKGCV